MQTISSAKIGDVATLIAQLKANMTTSSAQKQPMQLKDVYAENSSGYAQSQWRSIHARKGYTLGNTPPEALEHAQLDLCDCEIRQFGLNLIESKPKGLVITGDSGVGKTYSACAVMREVMGDVSVGLATDAEFVRDAKSTFRGNTTESALLAQFCAPYLLIIDDFGKAAYSSQWAVQLVFELLDQRLKRGKPTIVTTQYTANDLLKRLEVDGDNKTAEAIISRLRFFEKHHIRGVDRRAV